MALEGLGTAAAGALAALAEQGVVGERLCLPCAVKAGGAAGALTVLTLGVGRVPAVQRVAGRLGAWLGETRAGLWASARLEGLASRFTIGRATTATAAEIAERRAVAGAFYVKHGFDPVDLDAHLVLQLHFSCSAYW